MTDIKTCACYHTLGSLINTHCLLFPLNSQNMKPFSAKYGHLGATERVKEGRKDVASVPKTHVLETQLPM